MPVRFSYCPYRLLFKRPFGTAHGVRTGTDSVFVRAEMDGRVGYGEATLPPYLKETVPQVIERLNAFAAHVDQDANSALERLQNDPANDAGPGFRNAAHMALIDLLGNVEQIPVDQLFKSSRSNSSIVLMTLGLTDRSEVADRLAELPMTKALKVKVDGSTSVSYIELIKSLTDRSLFLDANQGLERPEQAMALLAAVGPERTLGIEQPFATDRWADHAILTEGCGTVVYGDESIQGEQDLERAEGAFSGVNIKLMKCGGLDRAAAIAKRAGELGLKVMLGSMSESSLGCTAMAHLAGVADVVDLDGPWLIANDPFEGIWLKDGRLVLPDGPGIGARLKADLLFEPIGT